MFTRLKNVKNLKINGKGEISTISFDCTIRDEITDKDRCFNISIPRAQMEAKLIKQNTSKKMSLNGKYAFTDSGSVKLRLDFEVLLTMVNDEPQFYDIIEK